MYFVIGTDGRHHGPLTQDDVRRWLIEGLASRYSRARRESEPQWQALREMPEFEEATRPPFVGGNIPSPDPEDQADAVEDSYQPRGASRGRLDPISCFRRAWYLVASHFAILAGWTLMSVVLMVALSLLPGVASVISLPANYLLQAAIYALFLSRMRGKQSTPAEILQSVRKVAVPIVVAGLTQALIASPVFLSTRVQSKPALFAALVVLLVPCFYLLVGYVFVLPLIVDRQLGVWRAMELSRTTVQRSWFSVFGLLLAAGLLITVSWVALGVGLVLTLPLCTGAVAFAYEDLFGD
ncbi:MAG: hypothetical protein U0Q11_19040 [Vicinamibacterales bacterium]